MLKRKPGSILVVLKHKPGSIPIQYHHRRPLFKCLNLTRGEGVIEDEDPNDTNNGALNFGITNKKTLGEIKLNINTNIIQAGWTWRGRQEACRREDPSSPRSHTWRRELRRKTRGHRFMTVFIRSRNRHLAHNVWPLDVLSSGGSLLFTLAEIAHAI